MADIARCVWCNIAVGESHVSCIYGEGKVSHGQAAKPPVPMFGPGPSDAERMAEQAKVVRQAIERIAEDSDHIGWWNALAERETDANLVKLWRLLK